MLTFARGEGSGENENEKCKFRRGHRALPTAPIGGGGVGDSSLLFLERETAKTLQSDTFASQVKATVSGLKDQRWELVNTDLRRNLPFL